MTDEEIQAIDPKIRLYIEENASAREHRARQYALASLTLLVLFLSAVVGLTTWAVTTQLIGDKVAEVGLQELKGQAEESLQSILNYEIKSREVFKVAHQARDKWEAKAGIELRRYLLNLPSKKGIYYYSTGVSVEHFASVGISDPDFLGKNCQHAGVAEVIPLAKEGLWRIAVKKNLGCEKLDVTVTFVPRAWVSEVYGMKTLVEVKP